MNQILDRVLKEKVVEDASGNRYRLSSGIDKQEGKLLYDTIISDESIQNTLEIGFGYGISSLYICEALRERPLKSHTIIDPYQSNNWHDIGIKHLQEAGINFFHLIEEESEIALPEMLRDKEELFDLIFIDGWHTFDHTMVDCFYANRLLKVGGYLAIDDINWKSVRRAFNYISNYPCYEIHRSVTTRREPSWKRTALRVILSPIPGEIRRSIFSADLYHKIFKTRDTTMVILKKVKEDDRNFHWYIGNF